MQIRRVQFTFVKMPNPFGLTGDARKDVPGRARALRPIGWKHAETASAFNPVGIEIPVIYSENRWQRFPLREIYESCVGEVHRPVPIAGHQHVKVRQLGMFDIRQNKRPGTDECPGCLHLRAMVASKMK